MVGGTGSGAPKLSEQEFLSRLRTDYHTPIVNGKHCSQYINPKTGQHTNRYYLYRRVYLIAHGSIPKTKPCICHACDNGVWRGYCCTELTHLFPGTNEENMWDASKKGRLVKSNMIRCSTCKQYPVCHTQYKVTGRNKACVEYVR